MIEAATIEGGAPKASAKLAWQDAVVEAIAPLSPRIRSVVLRPSAAFVFRAGQHVDVRLTAADGYRAQRSYSIASAPGAGTTIELAIERLDDGEVSPFFHDVVAVGDTIEMRGPIGGHFVWTPDDAGPVLLVGGGSGVVPLVSMVRARDVAAIATPMALLDSARRWDDIVYRDELLALEARGNGLAVTFALTRDVARRTVDRARRIDAAMIAETLARLGAAPRTTYVCGSNAFVDNATRALLDNDLSAASIRTERYGG